MQRTLRIITKINCIPRFFSTGNNTWKDRDSAVEKDYFNKEDEKAMRRLLKKVHETTAKSDPKMHESEEKSDIQEIQVILKKFGVENNEKLCQDLLKWKFE